jgi:hypothetical protein
MKFEILVENLVYKIMNSAFVTGVWEYRRKSLNIICINIIHPFWPRPKSKPYSRGHEIYNFSRGLPGEHYSPILSNKVQISLTRFQKIIFRMALQLIHFSKKQGFNKIILKYQQHHLSGL